MSTVGRCSGKVGCHENRNPRRWFPRHFVSGSAGGRLRQRCVARANADAQNCTAANARLGRSRVRQPTRKWRRRPTFTGRAGTSIRRLGFSRASRTLAARWCRAARVTTLRRGSTPSTRRDITSGTRATSFGFCGSACRAMFRWPPISTSPIRRATATAKSY